VGEDELEFGAPPKAAYDASGNSVAASIAIFKILITLLLQKWSEHGARQELRKPYENSAARTGRIAMKGRVSGRSKTVNALKICEASQASETSTSGRQLTRATNETLRS
jgi:hypothetical protein